MNYLLQPPPTPSILTYIRFRGSLFIGKLSSYLILIWKRGSIRIRFYLTASPGGRPALLGELWVILVIRGVLAQICLSCSELSSLAASSESRSGPAGCRRLKRWHGLMTGAQSTARDPRSRTVSPKVHTQTRPKIFARKLTERTLDGSKLRYRTFALTVEKVESEIYKSIKSQYICRFDSGKLGDARF